MMFFWYFSQLISYVVIPSLLVNIETHYENFHAQKSQSPTLLHTHGPLLHRYRALGRERPFTFKRSAQSKLHHIEPYHQTGTEQSHQSWSLSGRQVDYGQCGQQASVWVREGECNAREYSWLEDFDSQAAQKRKKGQQKRQQRKQGHRAVNFKVKGKIVRRGAGGVGCRSPGEVGWKAILGATKVEFSRKTNWQNLVRSLRPLKKHKHFLLTIFL